MVKIISTIIENIRTAGTLCINFPVPDFNKFGGECEYIS